jgi:hypothetical protein
MDISIIPLQAAMGAGLIIGLSSIVLLFFYSVVFTNLYINIGHRKYLKGKKIFKQKILLYTLSILLGITTAIFVVLILLGILYLIIGDTPLD